MNDKKLAEKIYDELHYAFDGYYTSDGGSTQLIEVIEKVIKENKNK
jgi:hypothetical protein